MASISFNEGEYIETLTNINEKIYTFRYIIPNKQNSEWCIALEGQIRNQLENSIPIPEIVESMSSLVKDLSIKEGNHLTRDKQRNPILENEVPEKDVTITIKIKGLKDHCYDLLEHDLKHLLQTREDGGHLNSSEIEIKEDKNV